MRLNAVMIRYCLPRRKEKLLHYGFFALIFGLAVLFVSQFSQVPVASDSRGKVEKNRLQSVNEDNVQVVRDQPGDNEVAVKSSAKKTRKPYEGRPEWLATFPRKGPGEDGTGVEMKGDDVAKGQEASKKYFFNLVASDKISMDR